MKSQRAKAFRELFAALPKRAQHQANEAYKLFKQDPFHPSLHFKPLDPAEPSVYSARVGMHYRVIGIREGDSILWV